MNRTPNHNFYPPLIIAENRSDQEELNNQHNVYFSQGDEDSEAVGEA